jgi:hypothetical protein
MSDNFEVVLNICLDRIAKGDSIKQCLSEYPQFAAQLDPLLKTALSIQRVSAIKPRSEFKAEAKYRILMKLEKRKKNVVNKEPFFRRMPRWATVLIVALIIILVGSSGTVAASANSLPGDKLYPVKIASERVQTAFVFSDENRVKVEVKLVERRVDELTGLIEIGDSHRIELAMNRFRINMARIQNLARKIKDGKEVNAILLQKLEDQIKHNVETYLNRLQGLEDKAQGALKTTINQAKNNLSQSYDELIKEIHNKSQNRNNGT